METMIDNGDDVVDKIQIEFDRVPIEIALMNEIKSKLRRELYLKLS